MRKNWSGLNVDLGLLASSIQGFFDERGFFTTVKGSASDRFVVRAEASEVYDIDGFVEISVNECSDGLAISLNFSKEDRGWGVGPLTMSFFGAGSLFVRRLKSNEDRTRLERDFWRFVDKVLPRFSGGP